EAAQMNEAVGAQAFTHGQDIYFGAGHSPTELALTAHELTHVVQQTGGASLQTKRQTGPPPLSIRRVCGTCAAGGSKCGSCAAEDKPIQRKALTATALDMPQRSHLGRMEISAVARTKRPQISRVPEGVQRYSWDEFTDDVVSVGKAAVQGAEDVGSAVVSGAEAVGQAVVSGAESVGEAVASGAQAVGEAGTPGGETVSPRPAA